MQNYVSQRVLGSLKPLVFKNLQTELA